MDDLHNPQDKIIQFCRHLIRLAVRALALLMTLVIFWGVVDVAWVLYEQLMEPPFLMLTMSDILATFGAFMAVLIAIEIFININIYLRDDVIHVKIVMATALMAIARKVIILDTKTMTPAVMFGIAAVVAAMSLGYWVVTLKHGEHSREICRLNEELGPDQAHAFNAAAQGHEGTHTVKINDDRYLGVNDEDTIG